MRVDMGTATAFISPPATETIIVLLVGGNKSTQPADIKQAKKMAKEV